MAPTDRVVTWEGTTFEIDELLPEEGFEVLEAFRVGLCAALDAETSDGLMNLMAVAAAEKASEGLTSILASALDADTSDEMANLMASIEGSMAGDADGQAELAQNGSLFLRAVVMRIMLGMPRETVREITAGLFRQVYFTNEAVPTRRPVAGNADTAFMGLTAMHKYRLLGRAFSVNFSESLAEFRSLIPSAIRGFTP